MYSNATNQDPSVTRASLRTCACSQILYVCHSSMAYTVYTLAYCDILRDERLSLYPSYVQYIAGRAGRRRESSAFTSGLATPNQRFGLLVQWRKHHSCIIRVVYILVQTYGRQLTCWWAPPRTSPICTEPRIICRSKFIPAIRATRHSRCRLPQEPTNLRLNP